jgi:hypothetical protein
VFRGKDLILVLQKSGRDLTVLPSPDDPVVDAALAIYPFLLGRQFAPPTSASVETVNGQSVLASPYADNLRRVGFTDDYRGMSLWKR